MARIRKKDGLPFYEGAEKTKGLTQNSIESVLKILRNSRERKPTPKPSERQQQMTDARDGLRQHFAEMLQTLDYEELMLFEQGFGHYFWPKSYADLRDTPTTAGLPLTSRLQGHKQADKPT